MQSVLDETALCDFVHAHAQDQCDSVKSLQRSSALLLLTLKEKHRLTQTAVNFAVEQIKGMVCFLAEDLSEVVDARLRDLGVANEHRDEVRSLFEGINPFDGLETEHLQDKFYRDNFNYVVSVKNMCCCFHDIFCMFSHVHYV